MTANKMEGRQTLPPLGPGYGDYRAALVEWHQKGLGGERCILVACDVVTLFSKLAPEVVRCFDLLLDEHMEYVSQEVLETFFEGDEEGARSELTSANVPRLLERLIEAHGRTLEKAPASAAILGPWYDFLSCVCKCFPNGDGVFVPIEDCLPAFTQRLLARETEWSRDLPQVSYEEAAMIGRLTILAAQDEREWRHRETYQDFWAFHNAFNEFHAFH